jgi:hypothetical protein
LLSDLCSIVSSLRVNEEDRCKDSLLELVLEDVGTKCTGSGIGKTAEHADAPLAGGPPSSAATYKRGAKAALAIWNGHRLGLKVAVAGVAVAGVGVLRLLRAAVVGVGVFGVALVRHGCLLDSHVGSGRKSLSL